MKCTNKGCDGVMLYVEKVGNFVLVRCGKCGHSERAREEQLTSKKVKLARRKQEKLLTKDPAALTPLEEEAKRLARARMQLPNMKHDRSDREFKNRMLVKTGKVSTLDAVVAEEAWSE